MNQKTKNNLLSVCVVITCVSLFFIITKGGKPKHFQSENNITEKKDTIDLSNGILDIVGYSSNFLKQSETKKLREEVHFLAKENEKSLFISGQTSAGTVAITFDDAPDGVYTERILNILDKHNIKATFFCIGKNILRHQGVIKKIHESGHIIANHSYSHQNLKELSYSEIYDELVKTNTAIYNIIEKYPKFFRPPYGIINNDILHLIREHNMIVVYWSLDSFDWLETKNYVISSLKENTRNGEIILFHTNKNTSENLEEIIATIINLGFEIVGLDELIRIAPYNTTD